ncbi:putative O-glycosylation ligase, exosortase A system-associated [Sulfuriferula sp.]|uniref:putative O-glycosylation ligase, exosortase A system-associated n=1 Tax=Sulfuriferula sp. TaxID=2025307 RepID=UPI002731D14E|nr:putative O-glycosylation ligase, exosortase A system-associated [Sulfuriferula sp.]MDP2025304.1 putative O-glycosylation ligase, exosortase A system-associated [Sulfuriferula sp.]
MRDLFVTLVVFGSLPYILSKPYVGIYMWSWLGYMNPHRLTWGFAYSFPFSFVVGIATLVALMFSREPKKIPWTRESIVLLLLIMWMLVTTIFSLHPALAWLQMEKVAKIQLMIFLTMILINNREKIERLVLVIALSLGFYGIKGGIFTVLHGGAYRVQGPAGTFIGGNNEMALALIMTIPLIWFLHLNAKKIWQRHAYVAAMFLCAIAVVGSQSRGALVGGLAMGGFLWLKTRNKLFTGLIMALAVAAIVSIMPAQWYQRMNTIDTYQTDASAQGRINAWWTAFNLSKDRPLVGGGFDTFQPDVYQVYAPDPLNVHDVHSIYFEMLGEHGWVGFGLFMLLAWLTWRKGARIIRECGKDPERKWAADLARMLQVSMIGFASAGAFLGLANFDLYYHLIAIMVVTGVVALKQAAPFGKTVITPVRTVAQPLVRRSREN